MTRLRTFVVGLPPSSAGLTLTAGRCCPKAISSSTTTSPFGTTHYFSQQCRTESRKPFFDHIRPTISSAAVPTFARTKSDLASSAQKSVDASKFKTASDLASKRPSVETPLHEQVPSDPARQPPPLDWNSFFKLRMRRRRIQVFFSALSGAGGLFVGAGVLTTGLAEPLVSQVPLDPIYTLGGLTIIFAAAGWLIGPTLGAQVFYMLNRRYKSQIKQKEAEFFTRVKKNRVDPSNASAANPVPDFYGEKIQSVNGYRRWLKDQRAFTKKKTANFV